MTIRKFLECLFLMILLSITGGSVVASAQHRDSRDEDRFRGIDRWAFKTNIIDWAVTIPNFSAEFDLSGAENNKMTLGLTARYNWNTHNTRVPYYAFNLAQLRPEYRYYWRAPEEKSRNVNRTNYVGAYFDAGAYSAKAGEYGHQGGLYTLGVSLGCAMPKYQYKKGHIDVEFGFAIGLALATDHAFTLDNANNVYVDAPAESKGLHVAPFPIVSSLNVSFAWRSESIKDKYKFTDADKIRRQEKEAAKAEKRTQKQQEKRLKKEQRKF